jgi:hypothetical protein
MNHTFHHVGIPTTDILPGERYSAPFKMYTSGGLEPTRIQYHRFEQGCPLHPLAARHGRLKAEARSPR